ncbi:MAG: anti-sigma factor [Pseudomonadota bacterium]
MTALEGGPERLQDLLIKRSLWGIDTGETRELTGLSEQHPDIDLSSIDETVALLDAIELADTPDVPPALLDTVATSVAEQADPAPRPTAESKSSPWPWVMAAALGVVAMLAWLRPVDVKKPGLPSLSAEAVSMAIAPGDDEAGRRAHGTIAWDVGRQLGQMKMQGIVSNDPATQTYQFWIVDAARDSGRPVSGGLFDVGDDGRANLWIHPAVRVSDAAQFFVTLEPAGGSVVTDRSRVVATAARR